jgi:hypothetical protein
MSRGGALLAALLLAGCASAPEPVSDREYDPGERPWQEIEASLPAFPDSADLIEVEVSPAISLRYYVDARSVSVGSDQVVRYTMVIRSPQGAENVSFEGLHCGQLRRKLYAVGGGDRTWLPARNPQWEIITGDRQFRHQSILYHGFFCPGRRTAVRDAAEAVDALKRGGHPDSLEAYQQRGSGQ